MKRLILFAAAILATLATTAYAGENRFQQFNADVDKAYGAYRKALFQTNMKDGEKSSQATSSFQNQWKKVMETYSSQPPEVFSSDPKWTETLISISEIAEKSSELINNGQLAEAHEHLEAVRDNLSDLRKRNSVIVFSDHINNYHEVMEGLLTAGYTPDKINESALNVIREKRAILNYLAEAIREHSPISYSENELYQQLQKALFTSLENLDQAIQSGKPEAVSKSIQMLKPAYAKLFLNFG